MPEPPEPLSVPAFPQVASAAPVTTDACEHAGRLYRQRSACREAWWVETRRLRSLEARLCTHLLSCLSTGREAFPDAEDAAGTFMATVGRLTRGSEDAHAWVLEGLKSTRHRYAVMDALCLCGEQAVHLPLADWYWMYPTLRAPIFRLWAALDMTVPEPCLLAALSDAQASSDQEAALDYLATRGPVALNHCSSFYEDRGRFAEVHPRVAAAACHTGMLCGDPQAAERLADNLDQVTDRERVHFARLLVLAEHSASVSALRDLSARDPLEAARLLALHGGRQALLLLTDVLTQCDPSDDLDAIAFLATGKSMPRGGGGAVGQLSAQARKLVESPDLVTFDERLRAQLKASSSGRWLAGEPVSQSRLAWLVPLAAGEGGHLLAERLAIATGQPLRVTGLDWITRRNKRLQAITDAIATRDPIRGRGGSGRPLL